LHYSDFLFFVRHYHETSILIRRLINIWCDKS